MKKITFLLLVFCSTFAFSQPALKHLKFDSSIYFLNKKMKSKKSFRYTVDVKIPSVELVATDGNKTDKVRGQGKKPAKNFGKNKPLSIVAVKLLYNIQKNENASVFMFGKNAAEGNFNSAEVTVAPTNSSQNGRAAGTGNNQIKVDLSGNEFYSYPGNGSVSDKKFLYVNASNSEKVEISIQQQTERGKVYVCIFDNKGKILKALNPKGNAEARVYSTSSPVFVIPVIAPNISNASNIVFEVGDPRQIAMVEIEEE